MGNLGHGLLLGLVLGLLGAGSALAKPPVGQVVDDIEVHRLDGAPVRLAELAGGQPTVLAFLGTECPLVRLYAARLNALAKELPGRGARLVGVIPNIQDTPAEVRAFVDEFGLTFPFVIDSNQALADAAGAERTPEVVLLDAQGAVRYRGRVDDQFQVAIQRPAATRHDLRLALDEVLAGQPVSQPEQAAAGCLIGRARPVDPQAEVTYSRQIARIFQARCVECHRPGEIGPFALTSYAEVLGWGDMIREVVDQGRMPPWFASPEHGDFVNDARLTSEEKQTIAAWVEAGCPEGDPAELPSPREFVSGWNIPQPDLVVQMADQPFQVPAEGVLPYEHYVVDLGLTEDRWVRACEARPGNRSVVHHILIYLIEPGQRMPLDALKGSLIAAYAPGSPARVSNAGVARKVKAGSKVLFQMHYTPNGKPQTDQSSLGLVFADPTTVKQEYESGWAVNFLFRIPPGDPNYRVRSSHTFREDRLLIQLTPHMHMRGKSFRYEAVYPNGTREVLLDVPRYDFNWQIDYLLREPKLLPKGTRLECAAHFDNSAKNLSNPDPSKTVTFGEQTWDEMMIGFFGTVSLPRDNPPTAAADTLAPTAGRNEGAKAASESPDQGG